MKPQALKFDRVIGGSASSSVCMNGRLRVINGAEPHKNCFVIGAIKPAFHVHSPRRIDSCWELRGRRRPQSQGRARNSPDGSPRSSGPHADGHSSNDSDAIVRYGCHGHCTRC